MKKILIFLFSTLVFAQDIFIFDKQETIGKSFRIVFENGIIFDACNCGCPKDAAAALAKWNPGDEIDIIPYVADAKGQIYLLKNLDTDIEVFSWLKDKKQPNITLPTITQIDSHGLTTSDHRSFALNAPWKPYDRIIIIKNSEQDQGSYLLVNLDNDELPFITAIETLNLDIY